MVPLPHLRGESYPTHGSGSSSIVVQASSGYAGLGQMATDLDRFLDPTEAAYEVGSQHGLPERVVLRGPAFLQN
eukprot:12914306-Prorocentrum_lima.AAC.1